MAQFIDRPEEDTSEDFSNFEEEQQAQPEQEPVEATPTEDDLPDKYKGKDVKEIVRMHQEAEKLLGRQSSEVGELRKVVDDFIQTQTNNQPAPQQVEEDDDLDFFVEPEKAVAKAIENHPEIQQAKAITQQMKQQQIVAQLREKHPDFAEILQDNGFKDWVEASKVRTRLLVEADKNYDFDAADELLGSWKERKGIVQQTQEVQNQERKRQLKTASTGTAKGSGEAPSKKLYRRADIIKLMQNDPDRYLQLADEITAAYAEGRVR